MLKMRDKSYRSGRIFCGMMLYLRSWLFSVAVYNVKKSLKQEDGKIYFPEPTDPKVIPYSVKQTYGKLLKMVEDSFRKKNHYFL